MAQAAADVNYQAALKLKESSNQPLNSTFKSLLKAPEGWQKTRHAEYPTTDLNLVTDPFTKADRKWLAGMLNRRLSPLIERIYGITPGAIRADDMFVVRYDSQQTGLVRHTDFGDISINILLSSDFEGGGTRFWNRLTKKSFATVQPTQVGQVLTHSSQLRHEGLPVSSGIRYILVGFLSVDRMDPFSLESTGLSVFNSWFSVPHWHVKFRSAYGLRKDKKAYSKWVVSLFWYLYRNLMRLGDKLAPHRHVNLVEEQNRDAYLASLDQAYEQQQERAREYGKELPKASWFAGQQVHIDFHSRIGGKWPTRYQVEDIFRREL
jgi:hypothetical protein